MMFPNKNSFIHFYNRSNVKCCLMLRTISRSFQATRTFNRIDFTGKESNGQQDEDCKLSDYEPMASDAYRSQPGLPTKIAPNPA